MKGELTGNGWKKTKGGLSVIEAVISISIAILFFAEVFNFMFIIENTNLEIRLREEAKILVNNNLRKAGFILTENFTATSSIPLESLAPFVMDIKFLEITQCRREIRSSAKWSTSFSMTPKELSLSRVVGNFDMLNKLGSDCGGNIFNSLLTGSTTIFAMSASTDDLNITGVDIFRGHIFSTATHSDPSAPDLIITSIDEFPRFIGSFSLARGLNSLDVANDYVFATQNSSTSQFVVFDTQNIESPNLIASSTLPGVAGSRPEGWSIYYYDSKIYIGTKRTAGHEFHIFDVSDPVNPMWVGSREVNHNINSIAVRDGTAYLATSGNIRDLIVLDVKVPSNIIQKTVLDLPGNEDSKSLYLIGNTLFVGRFKTQSNSNHNEFYVLDVSETPFSGDISILGSYDVGADVNGIRVAGPYAFLATSNPNNELLIINVSSSTSIRKENSFNMPKKATSVDNENGILVITTTESPGIYKIKLSNY